MDSDTSYVAQAIKENALLTVGQLAKLCNVSRKTIRYYDSINLIHPFLVSAENGYRYYLKQQSSTVSLIKQLQALDISLNDINSYLNEFNNEDVLKNLETILNNQKSKIDEQLLNLQAKQKKITALQTFCSSMKEQLIIKSGQNYKKYVAQPRKIIYRAYEGKYNKNIFRDYFKLIFEELKQQNVDFENIETVPIAIVQLFDPEKIHLKLGFELKSDINIDGFTVEPIKEGEYLSHIYQGGYPDLSEERFKQLDKDIKVMGLNRIGSYFLKFYINEALTPNTQSFQTEIEVQIK
ncbi:MerR family transcriptional regulator [Eubacteriaceae bacterium ES2]|nr:MerR family transcriptional regulator [Eubacteriaceae bacterium ES2]